VAKEHKPSHVVGPKSLEYLSKEPRLFPKTYWSERTKLARFVVAKAEGPWLIDVDGNRYIDLTSQWATNNLGNVHPKLLEVTIEAMRQYGFLIFDMAPHVPQYELAEKLVEISPCPSLTKVDYEISGTEAVENAVKFALSAKKRPLILSFIGQYHGLSIGTVVLGSLGKDLIKYYEGFRGSVVYAPYPYVYRFKPEGMEPEEIGKWCIDYIEDYILPYVAPPERISAVLFEPIVAEAGVWVPPDSFVHGLRKLADKYGWFLICDEVQTGFGRTGKMFAIEYWGIDVDLMPLGKGLSGGMVPISAILGSEEAMCTTDDIFTGSTFAGHPAACAAAKVNIEIMLEERLPERAARLGEEALKRMKEWVDKYEIVGDARGRGFLLGIELVKDKKTKTPAKEEAREVFFECIKNGVLPIWDVDEWVIRVEPPLNIEEELLDKALNVIEDAIAKVQKSR